MTVGSSPELQAATDSVDILFQDEDLVVVCKPAGRLVHPSELEREAGLSELELLTALTGEKLYPAHRLDRPTSGVLVFARTPEVAAALGQQFAQGLVRKRYLAIVRGHPSIGGIIRHALTRHDDTRSRRRLEGEPQPALTLYHRLGTAVVDCQVDARYPTSRYALLACYPKTGRRHQIRRHLKHLSHPIIGDSSYGKGPHNHMFEERFGVRRLYLHAASLQLSHPGHGQPLQVEAPLPADFWRVVQSLGLR